MRDRHHIQARSPLREYAFRLLSSEADLSQNQVPPVIIAHNNRCVKLSAFPELLEHFAIQHDTMLEVWSISLASWRRVRADQWIRLDGSHSILARLDGAKVPDFNLEITYLRGESLPEVGCVDLRPLENVAPYSPDDSYPGSRPRVLRHLVAQYLRA